MQASDPQIDISYVCQAPRQLVYRAFTDPDHFKAWWGPAGNFVARDEMEFDVRPGGYQRWTEMSVAEPRLRVQIHVDLTDVVTDKHLDGNMHVGGCLPNGVQPFETRIRVEFYDADIGRTRLRIRQWLPEQLTNSSEQGWSEALSKLHALLAAPAVSLPSGEVR